MNFVRTQKEKERTAKGHVPSYYQQKVKGKDFRKEMAKKKVMEEIRQKAEKEMEEKVRKAMEQAKATWEAEVVEREKEAFRSGWLRGVDKQYRRGGGRRVTGVLAELEWQAQWEEYGRRH